MLLEQLFNDTRLPESPDRPLSAPPLASIGDAVLEEIAKATRTEVKAHEKIIGGLGLSLVNFDTTFGGGGGIVGKRPERADTNAAQHIAESYIHEGEVAQALSRQFTAETVEHIIRLASQGSSLLLEARATGNQMTAQIVEAGQHKVGGGSIMLRGKAAGNEVEASKAKLQGRYLSAAQLESAINEVAPSLFGAVDLSRPSNVNPFAEAIDTLFPPDTHVPVQETTAASVERLFNDGPVILPPSSPAETPLRRVHRNWKIRRDEQRFYPKPPLATRMQKALRNAAGGVVAFFAAKEKPVLTPVPAAAPPVVERELQRPLRYERRKLLGGAALLLAFGGVFTGSLSSASTVPEAKESGATADSSPSTVQAAEHAFSLPFADRSLLDDISIVADTRVYETIPVAVEPAVAQPEPPLALPEVQPGMGGEAFMTAAGLSASDWYTVQAALLQAQSQDVYVMDDGNVGFVLSGPLSEETQAAIRGALAGK